MRVSLCVLLTAALSSSVVVANTPSSCTGPQYNPILTIPSSYSTGRKAPSGSYGSADLGKVKSEDDARFRCQAKCTASSKCASLVAQLTKETTYLKATCFLYDAKHIPKSAVTCNDKSKRKFVGYVKDKTNECFKSAPKAATKYCSSYLGIPLKTKTATVTPKATTLTVTRIATVTISTTRTYLATSTATEVATKIETSTASTLTETHTETETETQTETETETETRTRTVDYAGPLKRAAEAIEGRAAPVAAPACVTAGTPSTRRSAACKCLSIKPSTATKTATAKQPRTTTTTTTTTTSIKSFSTTLIDATITKTETETKTENVVATTDTTITETETQTETTTTVTTTTTTVHCPSATPAFCEASGTCHSLGNEQNNCGACGRRCANSEYCNSGACTQRRYDACTAITFCSGTSPSSCVCYSTTESGLNACLRNGGSCGQDCNSSADCPGKQVCAADCATSNRAGGCSAPAQDDVCLSPVLPRRLFKKKVEAGVPSVATRGEGDEDEEERRRPLLLENGNIVH